jgi:hypothetical protein
MTSSPDAAVLVTTSSSTAGKHMCRRLKSSNGGETVTFGDDGCCTRACAERSTQHVSGGHGAAHKCTHPGAATSTARRTVAAFSHSARENPACGVRTEARLARPPNALYERGRSGGALLRVSSTGSTVQHSTASRRLERGTSCKGPARGNAPRRACAPAAMPATRIAPVSACKP